MPFILNQNMVLRGVISKSDPFFTFNRNRHLYVHLYLNIKIQRNNDWDNKN